MSIDTGAFLWLDRLDDAVKHRAYDCTCQVGGVDAMSIDTDWLRHALSEIRRTHRNMSERVGVAEHRATRAEAQSEIRGRAVAIYQQRAREAEARVKAVRELHQQSALIRRIPRSMRQGHDDDQPFHYCTGCDGARYPCDTIRALDATTTQETR